MRRRNISKEVDEKRRRGEKEKRRRGEEEKKRRREEEKRRRGEEEEFSCFLSRLHRILKRKKWRIIDHILY